MKKWLSGLLALCMVLGLCLSAGAEASATGDIVILYTNDIHCAIDGDLGFSGIAAYKKQMEKEGNAVALIDAGDAIQGDVVGTLSKGSYIIDLMNAAGYDLAIPGNHEFDYGMERFLELTKLAAFPYVSANFVDLQTSEPIFKAYEILEIGGKKIAFVGMTTPKTLTSSSPASFQNAQGEWIYGFLQDEGGQVFYDAVQKSVDAARAEGADYVIAVAHLGIEETCAPFMSTDVILNTTGIDALIDGHSHSVLENEQVKNKDGKTVLHTQTGTKLQYLGKLTIKADGALSAELIKAKDADVSALVKTIQTDLADILNEVVAKSDVALVVNDPATDVRIIRNAETNLGDLCADAYRYVSGADIGLVNGGGVRALIPAGDITYQNIISVHPFGNEMCVVEATGQQILDALEMASRNAPGENGGFLQVSGLTYEIHMYLESTVSVADDGMFAGVTGEYRVKNVTVGGEALDLEKIYTVASHNFMLKQGGDGLSMFKGNTLLQDSVMIDNQVLITYIVEGLGGVVGEQYADPYGEGRIIGVPEAPAK